MGFEKNKIPWNKGLSGDEYKRHYKKGHIWRKKGNVPWNKGLSGEEHSKHYPNGFGGAPKGTVSWCKDITGEEYKKHLKNGKTWNEGLTKEMDERVANYSRELTGREFTELHRENISKASKESYKNGRVGVNKGKTLSEKTRMRMAKKRKELYAEEKIERLSGDKNPMYGKGYLQIGELNTQWKGGHFPYYGPDWKEQRQRALERSNYASEFSGNNDMELAVHHKVPIMLYIKKAIDLCYKPYIKEITVKSLKMLPYTIIPDIFFEEANKLDNLIVLTGSVKDCKSEHGYFEGMPVTFFEEVERKNNLIH